MTANDWQAASDPQPMLEFLHKNGSVSARKLRLFAIACSRRIWPWIEARGRAAVEIAERFADGLAGAEEMRAARLACQGAGDQAAWYAAASNPASAARNAARSAQAGVASNALAGSVDDERLVQASLLRDIFGDSFRPVTLEHSWLSPEATTLAQTIYTQRAFERMPELADVLAAAGLTNRDVLAHCRQPGQHVRGCWVVDLILEKE